MKASIFSPIINVLRTLSLCEVCALDADISFTVLHRAYYSSDTGSRTRKSVRFELGVFLSLSPAAHIVIILYRESAGWSTFQKRLRRVAKPRGPPKNPGSENPPFPGRPARSRKAFPYRPHLAIRSFEISLAHTRWTHNGRIVTHRRDPDISRGASSYRWRRPASTAAATANSQASRHSRESPLPPNPPEKRMEPPPQR